MHISMEAALNVSLDQWFPDICVFGAVMTLSVFS